jgi:hypothetical protein
VAEKGEISSSEKMLLQPVDSGQHSHSRARSATKSRRNWAKSPSRPVVAVGRAVGAIVFIALMSLVKEPARRNYNGIFLGGAAGGFLAGAPTAVALLKVGSS